MRIMLRLQWRTARFEIAAVALATLVIGVAAVLITNRLVALAPTPQCARFLYPAMNLAGAEGCPLAVEFLQFQSDWTGRAFSALTALAIAVGTLLGSQLVARELERRTATLAWSIEPGRSSWFWQRATVAAIPVALVALVVVILSGPLVASAYPAMNVNESFAAFGSFGPVLAARGFAAFALGVLIGALAGRTVPALLATAVLATAITIGASLAATLPAATMVVPDPGGARDPSARYLESVLIDGDGERLTFAEGRALAPAGLDAGDLSDWVYTHFAPAAIVIPGHEAPASTNREVTALGLVGGLSITLAFLVTRRRRPL